MTSSIVKQRIIVCLAGLVILAAGQPVRAQEAAIRVGDRLKLMIKGVPLEDREEVSGTYTVSDLGTIHLPYLQSDPKAAGLTASRLAGIIESAYRGAEIYTAPTIVITTDTPDDNTRRITVIGEVRQPRQVAYASGMTLLEAIAACGGFSDFAKSSEVRLIRGDNTSIHDVRTFANNPAADPVLQPGDKVVVPQRGPFG